MIKKSDIKYMYSLSPMQEGMLFHYLMDKESPAYFEQTSYRVNLEINYKLFERAFNQIIEKYDVLRSIFIYEKLQRPLQVVLKKRKATIHYEDISHLHEDARERKIKEFKSKDKNRGFDLSKDILIRLAILKIAAEKHEIIWSFQHIIMDGWCTSILIKDMLIIYRHLKQGKTVNLQPTVPFKNYINWLERQDKEKGMEYWKHYLANYENQAIFPTTHVSPGDNGVRENKYVLGEYRFWISKSLTGELERISTENKVTISTVFQTLWGILLQKYNDTDDVVFGSVVSGRPTDLEGVETIVGLFINTIPVRIKNEPGESFIKLLQRVQAQMIQSKLYEFVTLADIQSESPVKRGLINHIVIFENFPLSKEIKHLNNGGEADFSVENVEVFEQTNYNLNITVTLTDKLGILVTYNSTVYSSDMIERIETHLVRMIEQIGANPGSPVEAIEIISEKEKKHLLLSFNNAETGYPADKTLYRLFAEQAARTRDIAAVVGACRHLTGNDRFTNNNTVFITYQELNKNSHQLASLLRSNGVKPGAIVAIMAERSVEMVIGILGILQAGGAYLPIDPGCPRDRIEYMLKDSAAGFLLKGVNQPNQLNGSCDIIGLDHFLENSLSRPDLPDKSNQAVQPHDLAYVIYTSGSTGKPKGVMIEHRAVNNFITGITEKIPFNPGKILLAITTISFDIHVLETLLPLSRGVLVVVADEPRLRDGNLLADSILKHHADMLQATPSRMQMLIPDNPGHENSRLKYLKEIMVGGEPFPPDLLQGLKKLTTARIYNMYGPTETTVWSAVEDLTGAEKITLGRPIANTRIYILDKMQNVQPVGAPGELYIGGDGTARGYVNKPGLSAEKFVVLVPGVDARNRRGKSKIYRTGDLARWLSDGSIEFLGRIDGQVKIRGYRIELEEIRTVLNRHPGIKESVVAAVNDSAGLGQASGKSLAAYIVGTEKLFVNKLREHLAKELPDYMIPSFFLQLEQLPLTPNGKVDRKSLQAYDIKVNPGVEYVAPETEMEKIIADIWREVLKINQVGVRDNFFDIGGHSLSIIKINAKLKEVYPKDISIAAMFRYPTITALAEYFSREENGKLSTNTKKRIDESVNIMNEATDVLFADEIE